MFWLGEFMSTVIYELQCENCDAEFQLSYHENNGMVLDDLCYCPFCSKKIFIDELGDDMIVMEDDLSDEYL